MSRVANNILAILVVVGFGYIIHQSAQGKETLSKLKNKFSKFGGKKDGK